MLTDIFIERKLPIINGFVSIPDAQISKRNQVTAAEAEIAVTGSDTIRAYSGNGSGGQVSSGVGTNREWFVLPQFERLDLDDADHYQTLRNTD